MSQSTLNPTRRGELTFRRVQGSDKWLVEDTLSFERFLLDEDEWFLLGQLDGARSPQQICAAFEAARGEPLDEAELGDFIQLAYDRGLLQETASNTAPAETHILQDFCPLEESLEWQLGRLQWERQGVLPFVRNEVPHHVTSSGRLSEFAATVLFENCLEKTPAAGPLCVLELGAGTGLFARYFLDTFQKLCRERNRDFYERLTYYATDASTQTLAQWQESGIFAEHAEHVVAAQCDALQPRELRSDSGLQISMQSPRAVFLNYVLDQLPATIVRNGPSGPEQLHVRTTLAGDADVLTSLSGERDRTSHGWCAEHIDAFLPILPRLEFETAFRPVEGPLRPLADTIVSLGAARPVRLNHGAIACLEQCLDALANEGIVIAADYGMAKPQIGLDDDWTVARRYGTTLACDINFPFLKHHVERAGRIVTEVDQQPDERLLVRMFCRQALPRTSRVFATTWQDDSVEIAERLVSEADDHNIVGRVREAWSSYQAAIEHQPNNWHLLAEAADFIWKRMSDASNGVELSRRGLDINPWSSAWLWNIQGDCLLALERVEAARDTYLRAQQIDNGDPRALLGLARCELRHAQHGEALAHIAAALATDGHLTYRDDLIALQQEVLADISRSQSAARRQLCKRNQKLSVGSLLRNNVTVTDPNGRAQVDCHTTTARRLWRTALDGPLRQRATQTAASILDSLADHILECTDPGLAHGLSGMALAFANGAQCLGEAAYAKLAEQSLSAAIAAASTQPLDASLCSGLAGIGWTVDYLASWGICNDGAQIVAEIDEWVIQHVEESGVRGEIDLIGGLVGQGVYALERLPALPAADCLETIIGRLCDTAIHEPTGVCWKTRPEWMAPENLRRYPDGFFDLSVAHGTAGVIALLGQVCRSGVAVSRARPLLHAAVDWLLTQRLEDAASRYPYWVAPGDPPRPSRHAWCRGDLGIAAALFVAADCADQTAWKQDAVETARQAARRSLESSGVVDAGLCHGAAGLAHLFNRLQHFTHDPRLAEAARFWFEQALGMQQPEGGIAGYESVGCADERIADPGFLSGAAGVCLALLAASSDVEPAWDRLLLASKCEATT